MHALIVEDEPIIAMEIEDILRDNGYTSFAFAISSNQAILAARDRCPDLITSDVRLKPGSGIDAIEKICGCTPIPVIFITANPEDVRERLPHYQVLRKPFGLGDLQAAIERLGSGSPASE